MNETVASIRTPKRGVALYSYQGEFMTTMTLEDMFADMGDMGAEGLEILANSHIENYPNPTEEWLDTWFKLLDKYEIKPVEYGHWVDSRLYPGRELTSQESYEMLLRDIKLANKLGFTVLRTKLGVKDDILTPVDNWREFIAMALPDAEKYNVRMCPEIHHPTLLKSQMVDDYVEFIQKTGTKHFGLTIDFGTMQTNPLPSNWMASEESVFSPVSDFEPLLPYSFACHAKFYNMSDDFIETTTPYDKIIEMLMKNQWDGYLLSEYEGPNADVPGYTSDQLRKHHVMMRRLLGEK